MNLPIFFHNLKKESTKEYILKLLSYQKSLTNQKIFFALKKKFHKSVSYQTVRQALLELVDSKILTKNKKEYQISTKWINEMCEYFSFLKSKYINEQEIKIIDKNTKEITLNSLGELGHFILYSFQNHFFDSNNSNELYMFVHHLWIPFREKEKRDSLKQFFNKNKNYVFVKNKSFVNKLLAHFYKKFTKIKIGINIDEFFDFIIQDDCIAKILMPQELRNRMNKAYRLKNLNFKILDEFSDIAHCKYKIKIIILRDKELADVLMKKLRKL